MNTVECPKCGRLNIVPMPTEANGNGVCHDCGYLVTLPRSPRRGPIPLPPIPPGLREQRLDESHTNDSEEEAADTG